MAEESGNHMIPTFQEVVENGDGTEKQNGHLHWLERGGIAHCAMHQPMGIGDDVPAVESVDPPHVHGEGTQGDDRYFHREDQPSRKLSLDEST